MVSKVMGSEMVCCSSILAAEVATAQTPTDFDLGGGVNLSLDGQLDGGGFEQY